MSLIALGMALLVLVTFAIIYIVEGDLKEALVGALVGWGILMAIFAAIALIAYGIESL